MMHGEKTENESLRNLEEFTRWLQSDKNLPQNIGELKLKNYNLSTFDFAFSYQTKFFYNGF